MKFIKKKNAKKIPYTYQIQIEHQDLFLEK